MTDINSTPFPEQERQYTEKDVENIVPGIEGLKRIIAKVPRFRDIEASKEKVEAQAEIIKGLKKDWDELKRELEAIKKVKKPLVNAKLSTSLTNLGKGINIAMGEYGIVEEPAVESGQKPVEVESRDEEPKVEVLDEAYHARMMKRMIESLNERVSSFIPEAQKELASADNLSSERAEELKDLLFALKSMGESAQAEIKASVDAITKLQAEIEEKKKAEAVSAKGTGAAKPPKAESAATGGKEDASAVRATTKENAEKEQKEKEFKAGDKVIFEGEELEVQKVENKSLVLTIQGKERGVAQWRVYFREPSLERGVLAAANEIEPGKKFYCTLRRKLEKKNEHDKTEVPVGMCQVIKVESDNIIVQRFSIKDNKITGPEITVNASDLRILGSERENADEGTRPITEAEATGEIKKNDLVVYSVDNSLCRVVNVAGEKIFIKQYNKESKRTKGNTITVLKSELKKYEEEVAISVAGEEGGAENVEDSASGRPKEGQFIYSKDKKTRWLVTKVIKDDKEPGGGVFVLQEKIWGKNKMTGKDGYLLADNNERRSFTYMDKFINDNKPIIEDWHEENTDLSSTTHEEREILRMHDRQASQTGGESPVPKGKAPKPVVPKGDPAETPTSVGTPAVSREAEKGAAVAETGSIAEKQSLSAYEIHNQIKLRQIIAQQKYKKDWKKLNQEQRGVVSAEAEKQAKYIKGEEIGEFVDGKYTDPGEVLAKILAMKDSRKEAEVKILITQLAQETGLAEAEIKEVIKNFKDSLLEDAGRRSNQGSWWKTALKIGGYVGLGIAGGTGIGTAAGILGIRYLDRYLVEKKKQRLQEQEMKKMQAEALNHNANGEEVDVRMAKLYSSIALAKQRQIHSQNNRGRAGEGEVSENSLNIREGVWKPFLKANPDLMEKASPEDKDKMARAMGAIDAIEEHENKKEANWTDRIGKMGHGWVGKIFKGFEKWVIKGGETGKEKTVSMVALSAAAFAARELPGVKNAYFAVIGTKVGYGLGRMAGDKFVKGKGPEEKVEASEEDNAQMLLALCETLNDKKEKRVIMGAEDKKVALKVAGGITGGLLGFFATDIAHGVMKQAGDFYHGYIHHPNAVGHGHGHAYAGHETAGATAGAHPAEASTVAPVEQVAPPSPEELIRKAFETSNKYDGKDAPHLWGFLDKKAHMFLGDSNVKGAIPELEEISQSNGRMTYLIDGLKRAIGSNPESFGLRHGINIDQMNHGDFATLAHNGHFQEVFKKSLFDENGLLNQANALSENAVKHIEANNQYYYDAVSHLDKHVPLGQEQYNAMDNLHDHGVDASHAAHALDHAHATAVDHATSVATDHSAGEAVASVAHEHNVSVLEQINQHFPGHGDLIQQTAAGDVAKESALTNWYQAHSDVAPSVGLNEQIISGDKGLDKALSGFDKTVSAIEKANDASGSAVKQDMMNYVNSHDILSHPQTAERWVNTYEGLKSGDKGLVKKSLGAIFKGLGLDGAYTDLQNPLKISGVELNQATGGIKFEIPVPADAETARHLGKAVFEFNPLANSFVGSLPSGTLGEMPPLQSAGEGVNPDSLLKDIFQKLQQGIK